MTALPYGLPPTIRPLRLPLAFAVLLIALAILASPARAAEPAPDLSPDRFETFHLQGRELARTQLARGLRKPRAASAPRDQSFEGLRQLIQESGDPSLRALLPEVRDLERSTASDDSRTTESYTEALIDDFSPLARYIQHETGIPASIILAQIIVESGWGGSNATILKNNVLGLGVRNEREDFTVNLDLGAGQHPIRVRTYARTTAYRFETIGDCVLYYIYVLLQSPDNGTHYARLREYIRTHRGLLETEPDRYRREVLRLIARSYNPNSSDYVNTLKPFVERLKYIDALELAQAARAGQRQPESAPSPAAASSAERRPDPRKIVRRPEIDAGEFLVDSLQQSGQYLAAADFHEQVRPSGGHRLDRLGPAHARNNLLRQPFPDLPDLIHE